MPYSHYDGVRKWSFAKSDRAVAKLRLARLGERPQFVLHEGNGASATEKYLRESGIDIGKIKFRSTGFRNHNDAWILRPSKAREALRNWLREVVAEK